MAGNAVILIALIIQPVIDAVPGSEIMEKRIHEHGDAANEQQQRQCDAQGSNGHFLACHKRIPQKLK